MKEYVIGIDLGTSAVKVSAMDRAGRVVAQQSYGYPLSQPQPGYSEQNPQDWLYATTIALDRLILRNGLKREELRGISFSGQMHGLVLLDENYQVLRPAILWNDTRTTNQCQEIRERLGDRFIELTGNQPLEGFTLPQATVDPRKRTASLEKGQVLLVAEGLCSILHGWKTGNGLLGRHRDRPL